MLLFFCFALAEGVVLAGVRAGNAGDHFTSVLYGVRQNVLETFGHIIENSDAHNLLEKHCRIASRTYVLSGDLHAMTQTCVDFILDSAFEIANKGHHPNLIPWIPGSDDHWEFDYGGGSQPVTAKTNDTWHGAIYFHYERTRQLNFSGLFTLITHELGHKVRWRGTYIEDAAPIEGFDKGWKMLEAMAAAVYAYRREVPELVRQNYYPRYNETDWFWCTLEVDGEKTDPILFGAPREARLSSGITTYTAGFGLDGYGIDLSYWTVPMLGRSYYLKLHIRGSEDCSRGQTTVFALTNPTGAESEEPTIRLVLGNPICRSPAEIQVGDDDLRVSCVYDRGP